MSSYFVGTNITVIVSTFNRALYLPVSLDSLLAQTVPPHQVIVVDDGSQDNTAAVLQRYVGRIEVIRQPSNQGKAAGLNVALPRVHGDMTWIFDDDDVALPNAIEVGLRAMEEEPSAAFCRTAFVEGAVGPGGKLEPGRLRPLSCSSNELFFSELLLACSSRLPGWLVRSDCYRAVGGFDPALIRSQDYDMMLRLSRRYPGTAVDKPTFIERIHEGDRGGASDRHKASDRYWRWLHYDQIIFRRLWRELDLSEYLPASALAGLDDQAAARRLRIRRLTVAARQALKDEVLADLEAVIRGMAGSAPMTGPERRDCGLAFRMPHSAAMLCQDKNFVQTVRTMCRGPVGADLRAEFARGLYHAVQEVLRDVDPLPVGQMTAAATSLLGWSGFSAMLKSKAGPNAQSS